MPSIFSIRIKKNKVGEKMSDLKAQQPPLNLFDNISIASTHKKAPTARRTIKASIDYIKSKVNNEQRV